MGKVSRAAGVSQGLVNFHFQSKDALLEETLHNLAEEHRDLWVKRATPSGPPAQRLAAIVDAQFHPLVCNRKKLTVWFAFFGEAQYRNSYRAITAKIDAERMLMSKRFCAAINDEGQYGQQPDDIAQMLEALFDGMWLNILMYPDTFTKTSARAQIMAYLDGCFPEHFKQ